jgi:hypothetical protein
LKLRAKDSLVTRFLRWLYPDQRRTGRQSVPLFAYLGTVRASQPYAVGDISTAGFYMLTPERWFTGTVMPVTLQRTDAHGTDRADTITIQSTVVRCGPDGVGFTFVLAESEDSGSDKSHPGRAPARRDMELFLRGIPFPECEKPNLERAS